MPKASFFFTILKDPLIPNIWIQGFLYVWNLGFCFVCLELGIFCMFGFRDCLHVWIQGHVVRLDSGFFCIFGYRDFLYFWNQGLFVCLDAGGIRSPHVYAASKASMSYSLLCVHLLISNTRCCVKHFIFYWKVGQQRKQATLLDSPHNFKNTLFSTT